MTGLIRNFMRALEPPGLQSLISRILLIGLLILADGFLLLVLSSRIGGLYSLAAAASASLAGALVIGSSFARHSRLALLQIREGHYPGHEFVHLLPLFISLTLICIPGFFTDLTAMVFFLPPMRTAIGALLHKRFGASFSEIYNLSRMNEE